MVCFIATYVLLLQNKGPCRLWIIKLHSKQNVLMFCSQIQTGAVFLVEHLFVIIPLPPSLPARGSVTKWVCTQTCPSQYAVLSREAESNSELFRGKLKCKKEKHVESLWDVCVWFARLILAFEKNTLCVFREIHLPFRRLKLWKALVHFSTKTEKSNKNFDQSSTLFQSASTVLMVCPLTWHHIFSFPHPHIAKTCKNTRIWHENGLLDTYYSSTIFPLTSQTTSIFFP